MEERDRLSVQETATALGISEGAVRERIARGSLTSERDAEGRVWVMLDASTRTGTRGQTGGQASSEVEAYRMLVEELRDRVRSLEESNRENRRIIAGLVQRVPELEAAPEPDREDHHEAQEAAQETDRVPGGQDGRARPGRCPGGRTEALVAKDIRGVSPDTIALAVVALAKIADTKEKGAIVVDHIRRRQEMRAGCTGDPRRARSTVVQRFRRCRAF